MEQKPSKFRFNPEHLARERKAAGMTKKDLSIKAGLNDTVCYYIEKGGSQNPRISTLVRFAEVLGVPLDTIVYGAPRGTSQEFLKTLRMILREVLRIQADARERGHPYSDKDIEDIIMYMVSEALSGHEIPLPLGKEYRNVLDNVIRFADFRRRNVSG